MRNVLRIIAAVAAAIIMVLGVAVPSQAARAAGPTFTLDSNPGTTPPLPLAAAAADWSKNTGITVVVGDCTTGKYCIHFKTVPFACNIGSASGCAYGLSDGSCQVEVDQWVANRQDTAYTDELVTKHEAGHCIFRALGWSGSSHLPDSPNALMSASGPISPTLKEATLTSVDRRFTRDLVS